MRQRTSKMVTTGLFSAMITIMTAYICHIPYGMNGGYVHFGDALIYLAAVFLPRPYALAAAAIGGGLADLLTAPMWMPATVIIKMLIVLPFTHKADKILSKRNIIAPFMALLISTAGYYLAEGILFGSFGAALLTISGSLIQSGGSAAVFYILGTMLDKLHVKNRLKAELNLHC